MLPMAGSAANPASSGFDGKWELDKKAQQPTGGPEDLQIELKQDGPKLWVGIMTYELELTTDGTEKVNQIGPFAHNSRTTIDGNKMTTDFTASNEGGKVEGQWIRTLSEDRKQMTMQVLATASDGRKLDQTLVFKRK
jgi:hypothetical protein